MRKQRELKYLSTVFFCFTLSPSLVHTLSLCLTCTHIYTSQVRLADGRLAKGGRHGPDVEPTVQKAKGFDLPYHRGTAVEKERMLTGPPKNGR